MERNQWESAAEAILFALGEPVEETRLAQAMAAPGRRRAGPASPWPKAMRRNRRGSVWFGWRESWQLVSAPQWGETIRGLLSRRKPDKLSPAALETLAVVAYFQPVSPGGH